MAANINLNTGYQPSYIVNQEPNRFGGKQDDYLAKAEEAIQAASDKITTCREQGGDLKKLFFEIIADLSQKRAQIAKEHSTEDAENFGKRREAEYPGRVQFLVLTKAYKEYNKKILSVLAVYLKKMEESPGKFKKEFEIEDKFNGKLSKLKIEVLNAQDLTAKGYNIAPKAYIQTYLPDGSLNKLMDENHQWTKPEIEDYHERFRQFKKDFPEEYRKWKMANVLIGLNKQCPSPGVLGIRPELVRSRYSKEDADEILGNMKSMHVIVTLRTELNGKLYPLTQYITWMYENQAWIEEKRPSEHPIERMKLCSKVMLFHQDEFLINETLQEISKIFETAVTWNQEKQTLQELKDTMAYLDYLATHNIRDVRGTAAENEWLEAAVYRSLKVQPTIEQKERMMDLEAFSNLFFSKFREVYNQNVSLQIAS